MAASLAINPKRSKFSKRFVLLSISCWFVQWKLLQIFWGIERWTEKLDAFECEKLSSNRFQWIVVVVVAVWMKHFHDKRLLVLLFFAISFFHSLWSLLYENEPFENEPIGKSNIEIQLTIELPFFMTHQSLYATPFN